MSNYIDLKFINLLSTRLDKFKQKTDYLFNFRCPHCGDSTKNKSKARGYMYRVKNDMFFKCHNCGMGQSLGNFIKFLDSKLYSEYLLERYKGSAPATPKPLKQFDFKPKFEQSIKLCKNLDLNIIIERLLSLENKIKSDPNNDTTLLSYSVLGIVNLVKNND